MIAAVILAQTLTGVFVPRGVGIPVTVTKGVRVGAFGTNVQQRTVRRTLDLDDAVNSSAARAAAFSRSASTDTTRCSARA
jgi:hypothetical protein